MLKNQINSHCLAVLVLLLCATAAVGRNDEGQEWLRRANEQYEAGHRDVAVGYYLKAAEFNVVEAQFYLGYALYHGEGITQNYASAVMWFKRAANQGYAKAEYNLAFCYMEGKGVPADYEKAVEWLCKSASHGYAQAQLTLSEGYEKGVLVEQDEAKAKYWKAAAENNGHPVESGAEDSQQASTATSTPEQPSVKNNAPVVHILYPEDQSMFHTDVVKVKYQLQANGLENSTKVVAMVDGVPQPDTRAVRQASMIEVEVPNHDCTIMLYAQNEAGYSAPATIRLVRENAVQADMPRLLAVVVGVGAYDEPKLPPLKLATKDARDFADALAQKKGLPFADVQIKLLCDAEATRADVFEAMEWMGQEASPTDVSVFYYAGHGFRDEKDRFYFMTMGGTTDKLYNCFSAADFKNMADEVNCKFLVFTDACYSAALLEGNRSAAATHFVEQLRRSKNGTLLYASSASDTKSKEAPNWGNGAFTKALVEAFNGAARQSEDEGLSTHALETYLYKRVRKLTDYKQTPVFMNPNGMEHFNIFTYDE